MVDVNSADIMATLLRLKAEYETRTTKTLRLTFAGAQESHLLAHEIASAGVSVIATRPKPFPFTWDTRRMYALHKLSKAVPLNCFLAFLDHH